MARFPFLVGPAYTSWASDAENQECINFFQEVVETGQGKNDFALYGTPGLEAFVDLPEGPVRGMYTVPFSFPTSDRVFAVGGTAFCEITDDGDGTGTATQLGTVANDGYPVYFASNGKQLAIASAQSLYIYQIENQTNEAGAVIATAGTFTGPIRTEEGDAITPASVDFLGGYFVCPIISGDVRGQHRYNTQYDGLTWPDLNHFNSEAQPDRSTRGIVDHEEYWAFGDTSIQPFTITLDPDAPFQEIRGAAIQQGTSAPASAVAQDNSMFWLSIDPEKGGPIFSRADGYLPRRVSNHSVETYLANLSKEQIGKCRSYAFTMNGHPFIQLSFPGDHVTWRYDASISNPAMAWHKVGCWNPRLAQYDAHRSICHTFGFGQHLVGNR